MLKSLSLALGLAFAFGGFGCGSPTDNDPEDVLRIVGVTSDTAYVDGAEATLTVDIDYTLSSRDSGQIEVGFNAPDLDKFLLNDSSGVKVKAGSGHVTITTRTRIKDWGSQGSFAMLAILSEDPTPFSWSPLADDEWTLIARH